MVKEAILGATAQAVEGAAAAPTEEVEKFKCPSNYQVFSEPPDEAQTGEPPELTTTLQTSSGQQYDGVGLLVRTRQNTQLAETAVQDSGHIQVCNDIFNVIHLTLVQLLLSINIGLLLVIISP